VTRAASLICAAVFSASAFADGAFYAGGSLGQSRAKFGPEFDSTAATTMEKETSSFALKVFGGYEFNSHLGLEAAFARLGSPAVRARNNATGSEQRSEFRAESASIAVRAGFNPVDALSLFGKVGLTRNYVKVYSSPQGGSEPTSNRTGGMFGVGVGYALSRSVSLRAEYEDFGRFGKDSRNDPAGTGALRLALWSAGVAYHFR
jgi:OmpA-OmpF porin, OOP family